MSKISDSRKVTGVGKTADLAELKSVYRTYMKANHPDKFQDDADREEAEKRSASFIEAYHFLVSIAPETRSKHIETYKETIEQAQVVNFSYSKQVLLLDFSDGVSYEYFEVPRDVYNKLINADALTRFVRRRIAAVYPYRSVSQAVTV
jgi:DnaJ-class molecular chaperone